MSPPPVPPLPSAPELLLPAALELEIAGALEDFGARGVARVGRVISEEALTRLRERADDLMLGRVVHPGLFFQKDTETGRYEDLTYGHGYEGPCLNYRKIEKLERDPLFRALLENTLFERIARSLIPGGIALYRAVLFSKAPSGGTLLPWHQDGGRFWGLDRDPYLQIWTALDDAPLEAGCVEAIPGSHREGLATPLGGLIPHNLAAERGAAGQGTFFPAAAGEVLLIHNQVWHRSGANRTPSPRRAFSVCYLSDQTHCLRKKKAPRSFVRVFEPR